MGSKNYSQLSLKERIEIHHWHANGVSLRNIGLRLGRAASTISRELRRNSKPSTHWPGGYCPERAQSLTKRRYHRRCRYKLARQPNLLIYVREQLVMGRSPEQIAGSQIIFGA
jgi:transposase, IS30 family